MKVRTQTPKLADLRRGVMELYISDHPLDCLTCSANGDCELQDMAGAVGPARGALRLRGEEPPQVAQGHVEPLLHLRSQQVHRLLALRARLRGGAGHLRAHHRRPRLRFGGVARPARAVHGVGVRIVRRLRAGLPDGHADGQQRHRERHARPERDHHLRLLRRRLRVRGRDEGVAGRPDDAVQERARQSRPLVREGPVRLGLRDAQGPHHQADDPEEDHRPVAGGELGRGHRLRGERVQAAPAASTAAARSAPSPRRAAPTKRRT